MRFSGRILLVIGAGLMAIMAGWLYQEQLQQRELPTADLEIPDNIDYYFTDMTYRVVKDTGETAYRFESPRLEHHLRGDTSFIQQPAMTIFRDDDVWTVHAQTAELKHETEVMHLAQQVKMQKQGEEPLQLESERAIFASRDETITFPDAVQVISNDAEISAASAVLDMKNNVYHLKQTRTVYRDETS